MSGDSTHTHTPSLHTSSPRCRPQHTHTHTHVSSHSCLAVDASANQYVQFWRNTALPWQPSLLSYREKNCKLYSLVFCPTSSPHPPCFTGTVWECRAVLALALSSLMSRTNFNCLFNYSLFFLHFCGYRVIFIVYACIYLKSSTSTAPHPPLSFSVLATLSLDPGFFCVCVDWTGL